MSEFEELKREVCDADRLVLEEETPCTPPADPMKEEWWTKTEPWYEPSKGKYYVNQSILDDSGKVLQSKDFNIASKVISNPLACIQGTQRIIEFFNFDLTIQQLADVALKCRVEEHKVFDAALRPVSFLVAVPISVLPPEAKDAADPEEMVEISEDEITIPTRQFFKMLAEIIEKFKCYSKYQAYMFYVDKIKIVKTDDKPFYLSFVAERMVKFERALRKFLAANNLNPNIPDGGIDKIVMSFQIDADGRRLNSILADNTDCSSYKSNVIVGLQEFLNISALKDKDVVEYLFNIQNVHGDIKTNSPWVDVVIKYGKDLKAVPLTVGSFLPQSACLTNFDPLSDAILDQSITFFEKLEYLFNKKNSLELENIFGGPPVFKAFELGQPPDLDGLLTDVFKNATAELPNLAGLNPDDIRQMFISAFENVDVDMPDWDQIYQFFSPQALGQLLSGIFKNFSKILSPEDLLKTLYDKAMDLLDFDKLRGLIGELDFDLQEQISNLVSGFSFPDNLPEFSFDFIGKITSKIPELLSSLKLPRNLSSIPIINDFANSFTLPEFDFSGLRVVDLAELINSVIKNFPSINIPNFDFSNITLSLETSGASSGDIFNSSELDSFLSNLTGSVVFDLPEIGGIRWDDPFRKLNLQEIATFMKLFDQAFISKVPELSNIFKKLTQNPFNILDSNLDLSGFLDDIGIDLDISGLFKDMYSSAVEKVLTPDIKFELFNKIPEFQKIADLVNVFSIPGAKLCETAEFLEGMGDTFSSGTSGGGAFSADGGAIGSFMKLPSIPIIPGINFDLIKFIKDNIFYLLEIVIKKLVAILINKLVNMLKNEIKNGLNNAIDQSSGGEYDLSDGLVNFVDEHVCGNSPEIDHEDPIDNKNATEASMAMLRDLVADPQISNDSYDNLARVIGVSSSIFDVINAVVEDGSKVNQNYIDNITAIVQTSAPEFSPYFSDPDATKMMFQKIKDFMLPETIQKLKDYLDDLADITNADTNFCIPKEGQEQWKEDRAAALMENGFDPEVAEKFVNDELQKIKDDTSDLLDLLTADPGSMLGDSIEDALNNSLSDCPDKYASPEEKETADEIKDKQNDSNNLVLEKINLTFVDDLLNDQALPFQDPKGLLSKMFSDVRGRSMRECNDLRENFLTRMLLTIGFLPEIQFANSIGKDLTESIKNGYFYLERSAEVPFKTASRKSLFKNFLPSIQLYNAEVRTKKSDVVLSYESGIDIGYSDHYRDSLEYHIKIGDEYLIKSNTRFDPDVIEKYPLLASLNKSNYISQINSVYDVSDYARINRKMFGSDFIQPALNLGNEIVFGYPEELTRDIFDDVESGNITDSRLQVLDPELFGSFFGAPKFHINPKELPDGMFKDSQDFHSRDTEFKLNKTILYLKEIADFIDDYKKKIKADDKCIGVKPHELAERPFAKVHSKSALALAQGAVRAYIRTYIAEYIVLAQPVLKKVGFQIDTACFASYIMTKMKDEIKSLKFPSRDVYSSFVTHILMLQMNAQAYITLNNDSLSDRLMSLNDDYNPLSKYKIRKIKKTKITGDTQRFSNYLRGYYAIAFQDKYKAVYDASSFMSIDSSGMTANEIKFADRLGYSLEHIDVLNQAFMKTIEQELEQYSQRYTPTVDIYREFVALLTGEDTNFETYSYQNAGWGTQRFFELIDKDGTSTKMTRLQIKTKLDNLPLTQKLSYISAFYGNAVKQGDTYTGTIGIKYGVALLYKGKEMAVYAEDVQDRRISNFIQNPEQGIEHDCYVDRLFKTTEARLIIDHAFNVKKIPTIVAIHYIENLMSSIGVHEDEQASEFSFPFGDGNLFSLENALLGGSGRSPNFVATKREIKQAFIDSYVREFYDPTSDGKKNDNFFDRKAKELVNKSVNAKNFAIDFASGPNLFQQMRIVDKIPIDKDGNPLVNKFLSSFKGE